MLTPWQAQSKNQEAPCESEGRKSQPWKDPESLFCDTDFLKNCLEKNQRRVLSAKVEKNENSHFIRF